MQRVKFGTSGIRGLVIDLTDKVCYHATLSFLAYLKSIDMIQEGHAVGIGGDLRHSSPQIMNAIAAAVVESGYQPINCGFLPTPALALYGIRHGLPTMMVTGSHIPDDRNGIKFNTPKGEVLKADEQGILAQNPALNLALFDEQEQLFKTDYLPEIEATAQRDYLQRYLDVFPSDALTGFKVGVYQHSSVARDLLPILLAALGAEVVYLGYSDKFISVDTEAIRPEDVLLADKWTKEYGLDAIISTDGDADRPLVSNELGEWLRGDVIGILVARFLNADAVVTPVSSNSALEKSQFFTTVKRTQIGSPYVISAMQALTDKQVVGYEANGGFLLNTDIELAGKVLAALPTRDAVLVPLCLLFEAKQKQCTLSQLFDELPARFTYSDRLKDFSSELSQSILKTLQVDSLEQVAATFADLFNHSLPAVIAMDKTDGVRLTLNNDEVVHLRGSGNAPELRCYTEAATYTAAKALNKQCMDIMVGWKI